ncbi:spermatogenesis-associated protein 31A3-like [Tamandua tetradactyla]|uniref:spermatogenesis-associated protein 31A3-like n=1 Tax=Tamandua tetradactyla TaxID=48850 RepID=UPI0040542039
MALPLNTPPDDNSWLAAPVPEISDLDSSGHPISALSWWQTAAKALFSPNSKHHESQQEQLPHQPQEGSLWGGPITRQTEAGSPYFFSPGVEKPLEKEVTKRAEFDIFKENEKDRSFLKPMGPDYQLNSLENMIKSLGDQQDITVPQPFWNTKDKPDQRFRPEQVSYHTIWQDHLKQKYNQLFWGLPSLHSESLVATAWVSGSSYPLQSSSFLFNRIPNSCPVQMQIKGSALLSRRSHSEFQSQHLIPNMPQSQAPFLSQRHSQPPSVAHVQTQAHLQSSLLLPSSTSQIRASGLSCSTSQNETRDISATESQQLEWPLLQKQLESRRTLSSLSKRSQETFSSLTYNLSQESCASWAKRSVSTISENALLSPSLRTQLEQHLQQRLTQHPCGLPQRIQQSLGLMQPQGKLPGTFPAKDNYRPSWATVFAGQGSKDVKKMGFRHPESTHVGGPGKFQLGKDPGKGLWQNQGSFPINNSSRGAESTSVEVLMKEPEKKFKSVLMRHLENFFPRLSDQKHRESALRDHLDSKLGHINEGNIPLRVRCSRLAASHTFSWSATHVEARNLTSLKYQKCHVNTSQELSFLTPGTQQALEAHSKRFWVKHKWDIPLKALKPIKLLKLKKAQASPLQQFAFPTSAIHESCVMTAKVGKPLREELQKEKVVTTKSPSTLESPLPALIPASEEVQRGLIEAPPGHDQQLSEVPLMEQDGRQPPQPLTPSLVSRAGHSETVLETQRGSPKPTPSQVLVENRQREESGSQAPGATCPGVTMLETVIGSQHFRAEDSREATMAEGSPALQPQHGDNSRTSEQADSLVVRVDLSGLGSPGTSKVSTHPRTSAVQVPDQPCPKVQAVNELEIKMKVKPGNELPDGLTDTLLATGILASQVPQGHPQSMTSGNRPVPHSLDDMMVDAGRSLCQQNPRVPQLQVPLKSQGEMLASTEKGDCRRSKLREKDEESARFGTSQARRMHQLAQVRGVVDTVGSKYLHILPEKGQTTPESHFKKRLKHLLQWIFPNKKGKGQESKPSSASAQSQRHRSIFTDNGAAEAQELTAVGEMLEKKKSLHTVELCQHKQKAQIRAEESSCYLLPNDPFHPEQRRVRCFPNCSYHTTPEGQSSPNRDRQVSEQHYLKTVRFNDDCQGLRQTPPSQVDPHHHLSWVPGALTCTRHCPWHCRWEGIFSAPPESASPGSSSSKTSL